MAIPRAIQEQAERAEALQRQMSGNTAPQAPAPVTPAAEQSQPEEKPAPQAQAPEQRPEAPVAPQTAEQAQPPAKDPWKVKYDVLEGKYSAEVPRLHREARELKSQIETLQQQVDALKAAQAQAPTPLPVDINSMSAEDVVEKFGEDFVRAVGAVAAKVVEQPVAKMREEFAPKVQQVVETTARTARSEFMRDLAARVPEWQKIDVEDGFTTFLDQVDPMTGRTRREFFNEADRSNDAARIANFFLAYRGQVPASVASQGAIEQQLAPDTTNAAPAVPPGKKVWRRGEIQQFYAAARRGAFTETDYKRIESDIFAAQREGRIAA